VTATPRRRPRNPFAFLVRKRELEHETSLFLLVSLLDFFMTYWMLMHQGDGSLSFAESNPFARYFLDRWGFRGLLYFKIVAVLVVVLITIIVAERKIHMARAILWLGILGTAAVVIYSFRLYMQHTGIA
jgi:hypothetical protein